MNPYRHFIGQIEGALRAMQAAGELPSPLDFAAITAEPPRDAATAILPPMPPWCWPRPRAGSRAISPSALVRLRGIPAVVDGQVAGPGFINLKLTEGFWRERLGECLAAGIAYGDSTMGGGAAVNVEYVSAQSYRAAACGPCAWRRGRRCAGQPATQAGFAVTKEYYVNDAGARSTSSVARPSCATRRRSVWRSVTFPKVFILANI